MNRDLNTLQPGDTVRYSVSAIKAYGIAKEFRARNATVIAVYDGYATIRWANGGGDRNLPDWALALYWRPGMDGRAA